jgi:hypothetical protein
LHAVSPHVDFRVVSKKHPRVEPVVVDKHIAADMVAPLLTRRPINATTARPTRPYRGEYAGDEDFSHVLQLGWENEAVVLTADGEMIEKALRFEKQFPKAESCLRGVIVLPPGKQAQLAALRRFIVDGADMPIPKPNDGTAPPNVLDVIEDYNLGVDLRKTVPRIIYLCDCQE